MKSLQDFVYEASKDDNVYAVLDFTGSIQSVFNTKEEADTFAKTLPPESKAEIKTMKRSEVEKD